MRLLSTHDLTFKEFHNIENVEYTILSHTWGDDDEEVTYEELFEQQPAVLRKRDEQMFGSIKRLGLASLSHTTDLTLSAELADYGPTLDGAPTDFGGLWDKPGFHKLWNCAQISKELGYHWTWVDTCCIDKRSSAELSESINSMFEWYSEAAVCFVYLQDVSNAHNCLYKSDLAKALAASRWFTRGWTLQELLAPRQISFFDQDWQEISYCRSFMARVLSDITSIPFGAFDSSDLRDAGSRKTLSSFCVAERMSWAKFRETSQVEDIAYCLLGIFGITMPLLYGEGSQAFRRLQEEILKSTADSSIFLWRDRSDSNFSYRGLFALHPREFEYGNDFGFHGTPIMSQVPFVITSFGVHCEMCVVPLSAVLETGMLRFTPWEGHRNNGVDDECNDQKCQVLDEIPPVCRGRDVYLAVFVDVNTYNPLCAVAILLQRLQSGNNHFLRCQPDTIIRIGGEPSAWDAILRFYRFNEVFVRTKICERTEIDSPLIWAVAVMHDDDGIVQELLVEKDSNVILAQLYQSGQYFAAPIKLKDQRDWLGELRIHCASDSTTDFPYSVPMSVTLHSDTGIIELEKLEESIDNIPRDRAYPIRRYYRQRFLISNHRIVCQIRLYAASRNSPRLFSEVYLVSENGNI